MSKVERRLSVSIIIVDFLVCAAASACIGGVAGVISLAASFACCLALTLLICFRREPDSFVSVFASSGVASLVLSGAPSGLLYMFIPIFGLMTGVTSPEPEDRYAKHSTAIAALYFTALWAVRLWAVKLVPAIDLNGNLAAEAAGMFGALIAAALIVHVEEHKRELLKFKAKVATESAEKDPLTGLNNRKSLENFIYEQAQRIEAFSVIMMDIDNFKKVNDTYGHVEGDAVLKDLALVIKCHIRGSDCAFRYGGEEFAIVCPKTPMNGAGILAERIRKAFSDKVHHYEGFTDPELSERRFTVSLGVAESRMGEFTDAKSLIANCDEALYEAKHNGKNQVRYYRAPGDAPKLGS